MKGIPYYIPQNILSFVSKIVPFWQPQIIFDPACGTGSFLFEINAILKTKSKFLGIYTNNDALEIAEEKSKSSDIDCEFLAQDFSSLKNDFKTKFDLIISNPPFGGKIEKEMKVFYSTAIYEIIC